MLIVDAGPLVATADDADPDHLGCRALLEGHPGPLVTTALVITEAGWLIRRQLDAPAEAALYSAIAAGEITVEALTDRDWARIAELVTTYADASLDAADASVIALAERLDQTPSPLSITATSASCAPPTATPSNCSPEPTNTTAIEGRARRHRLAPIDDSIGTQRKARREHSDVSVRVGPPASPPGTASGFNGSLPRKLVAICRLDDPSLEALSMVAGPVIWPVWSTGRYISD